MVAPLGMSPPVVTEFLQHLELSGSVPDLLVVIRTSFPKVEQGFRVMAAAVGRRYPGVEIADRVLDYQDVDDQEKVWRFLGEAADALAGAADRRPLRVLISGGRKTMTVALALLASLLQTEGVYHVVVPDIRTANAAYEALAEVVAEVAGSPDPGAAYAERAEELDPVFWPDPSTYNVIRIPVLPHPPEALGLAAEVLSGGMTKGSFLRRGSPEYLAALGLAGLLSAPKGGRLAPSDAGLALGRAIRRLLGGGGPG